MADIVERLRKSVTKGHEPTDEDAIEAAAEIERLRAWNQSTEQLLTKAGKEIERLQGKLAQLERDWDLRADAIRRTQKLHRAELKRARAGG